MSTPSAKRIFLSTVSAEFRAYRELLTKDIRRANVDVCVQEDFGNPGATTLEKLDSYIAQCDAVVHLVGDGAGAVPPPAAVQALLKRHPDLPARLGLPDLTASGAPEISYTQWEAYLALYHHRPLHIYHVAPTARRPKGFQASEAEKQSQERHFRRIRQLGRCRDQFLTAERLSSMVLGDLREILPPHGVVIDAAPSHLRHTAEQLVGREAALSRLDEAWAAEHTHVVVIRAWGGVGKTSLAATWMAELALKGWRGAERYFDWSFYSQGTRREGDGGGAASADQFIADALRFFGDPDPQAGSPWDRGARLAGLVGRTKSLLVLDGLEPLQQPPGPLAGQLKDPALIALLKGLAQQNAGLCVVTTREKVTDLASHYGRTAIDWELEHLSEEAGTALLRTLGVNGPEPELREASREVKGHALTLQLMGSYLRLACEGDIRKRDTFEFSEADAEVQGGHAFRVLATYERWLEQDATAGPRMLAILRLLGLFDRPADPGCLGALRTAPAIPGLTEALVGLSDAQWNLAVSRLEEIGLVTRVPFERTVVRGYSEEQARPRLEGRALFRDLPEPEEFHPPLSVLPREGVSLEAHPLLREHFAQRLREMQPDAWRAGHRRLYEHLQQRVPYWPEGLEGLQPLYQAAAHGCQAGLHQHSCDHVYFARILRGTGPGGFYSTRRLGAVGVDLGAVASFFETPWSTPAQSLTLADRGWLLNQAATRLRGLGRLAEAVEPMRVSLEMRIDQEKWLNAAIAASNLSELELELGDVSAAVAHGEQAVTFADWSEDRFQRVSKRATHANAQHQAGSRGEAQGLFREAEVLQSEDKLEHSWLYSLQGFEYCDLLLADTERAGWRLLLQPGSPVRAAQSDITCSDVTERASRAIKIAERNGWLLDIALDNLTLGRAAFYEAILNLPSHLTLDSTVKHVNAAVDGLRAAGTMDHLPRALNCRALLRFVAGDETGCRADLDEAWEIAERGPMRLYMADIQLTRARLFRDREALAEARKLIQQTGYHRRDEELADAEAALG